MAVTLSADELSLLELGEINEDRLQRQTQELYGLFIFINHSNLFLVHTISKEFLVASGSHFRPGASGM